MNWITRMNCAALAAIVFAASAQAANISWSVGDNYNGPSGFEAIDTSGILIEATNLSDTVSTLNVDPGGINIDFVPTNAVLPNSVFSAGSAGSTDANWNTIVDRTDFSAADTTFQLTGLTPGAKYQVQLFGSDARGCCATRTQFYHDGNGNNSAIYTQGTFTSILGTFTADAATQTIGLSASSNNPILDAYVVRDVNGTGQLGGDISSRDANGDGDGTVFFTHHYAVSQNGVITSVDVNAQGGAGSFELVVLRPNSSDGFSFDVIGTSGAIAPGAASGPTTFLLPTALDVQKGDMIAHLGRGIPFTESAAGPDAHHNQRVYANGGAVVVGNSVVLGGAGLGQFNIPPRDYAVAANVPGEIERVGFGTLDGDDGPDTASRLLVVLDDDAVRIGGRVDQFHFFNNEAGTAGRLITPVLLRRDGTDLDVIGIGATRTGTVAGLQMWDFDLQTGTDWAQIGDLLGFYYGDQSGTFAQGSVEYTDNDAFATLSVQLFSEVDGIQLTDTFDTLAPTFNLSRVYHANFVLVVPAPAALPAGLAMIGLLAMRRKR